jgi:hypothetical protein
MQADLPISSCGYPTPPPASQEIDTCCVPFNGEGANYVQHSYKLSSISTISCTLFPSQKGKQIKIYLGLSLPVNMKVLLLKKTYSFTSDHSVHMSISGWHFGAGLNSSRKKFLIRCI